MVKVLQKAFDLLEYVIGQAGRPVTPAELSEKFAINNATCVRLLKNLVQLGYLEQPVRSQYLPGPMLAVIGRHPVYRRSLLALAEPLIHRQAAELGESVLLAVLQHGRRYIICHRNCNLRMKIFDQLLYHEDLYVTATGRMLLACGDDGERAAAVKQFGLPPAEHWPEAATPAGFEAALRQIRAAGRLRYWNRFSDLHVMAFPIFEGSRCIAALGASLPETEAAEKGDAVFAAIEALAGLINRKLEPIAKNFG
jgi:DNA-binding IclR family transcriptional regulator